MDVHYDGEIDEPAIKEPKCDLYPTKLCQYADTDYCIKYFKYDNTFSRCKHYSTPPKCDKYINKTCRYIVVLGVLAFKDIISSSVSSSMSSSIIPSNVV